MIHTEGSHILEKLWPTKTHLAFKPVHYRLIARHSLYIEPQMVKQKKLYHEFLFYIVFSAKIITVCVNL
jgi:hypothetical protein